MMLEFKYGNTTIPYSLDHHDNDEVKISVDWMNGVMVKAPSKLDHNKLSRILYKKAPWILTKWYEFEEVAPPQQPKEFISGEKIPYIGRNYRLKVHKTVSEQATLRFEQGKFIAYVPADISDQEKREQMLNLFKNWYIKQGQAKLKNRLKLFGPKLEATPEKLILKEQKMRWGTCTNDGAIYLNWRIMMAPMRIIDYVLVHELAHLKHPNHSNEFWRLVRLVLPDYDERKEWLRINGPTLNL